MIYDWMDFKPSGFIVSATVLFFRNVLFIVSTSVLILKIFGNIIFIGSTIVLILNMFSEIVFILSSTILFNLNNLSEICSSYCLNNSFKLSQFFRNMHYIGSTRVWNWNNCLKYCFTLSCFWHILRSILSKKHIYHC